MFFVSVAAKGLSLAVNLLFATLAGRCISVAAKGLSHSASLLFATLAGSCISVAVKGFTQAKCWRESNRLGWEDLGGVRRTAWRAGPGTETGMQKAHIVRGARRNRADLTKLL